MRKLAIAVALLAAILPLDTTALEMSKAPMVRKRISWRAGRSELKPSLGWTLSDRYFHNFIVSAGYNYHLLNWLALGANVGWAFPIKTSFAENVEAEKKQEGMSFPIPASHLGFLGDIHVEVGDSGKFMFWGKAAMAYDFHFILGVGLLQVRWNSEASARFEEREKMAGFKFSPKAGLGFRLFMDKGVALTLDFIDHMAFMHTAAEVSANYESYTFPKEVSFVHNVAAMLSFSIMMPYDTDYED